MRKLIIILTFFLMFLNCVFAADVKIVTKEYKVVTKDGFLLNAKLQYPNIKKQREFPSVVLLHSLGYSSEWWENLPDELLKKGYAVVLIDLRGHGNSVYNPKLVKVSWKNLTKKAFARYPDDMVMVIKYIENDNKRVFFDNWAVVGSDIGASTAVLAIDKLNTKPKTIVMLTPVINAKGLYIPIKFAEMDNIDVLSIIGNSDKNGEYANGYLKKFAQSTFTEYISGSSSSGMLLLKNDKTLAGVITGWIQQYLSLSY